MVRCTGSRMHAFHMRRRILALASLMARCTGRRLLREQQHMTSISTYKGGIYTYDIQVYIYIYICIYDIYVYIYIYMINMCVYIYIWPLFPPLTTSQKSVPDYSHYIEYVFFCWRISTESECRDMRERKRECAFWSSICLCKRTHSSKRTILLREHIQVREHTDWWRVTEHIPVREHRSNTLIREHILEKREHILVHVKGNRTHYNTIRFNTFLLMRSDRTHSSERTH